MLSSMFYPVVGIRYALFVSGLSFHVVFCPVYVLHELVHMHMHVSLISWTTQLNHILNSGKLRRGRICFVVGKSTEVAQF